MIKKPSTSKEKKPISLERGKRIRLARHLVNLTRNDMFTLYNINPNTLHAWEKGVNRLTEESAIKLVDSFNKAGLSLTKEWLLYGDNHVIVEQLVTNSTNPELREIFSIHEDVKIFKEIKYFLDNNQNSIGTMVIDDTLLPFFYIGDYVGGVKANEADLVNLVGEFCILTSKTGKVFVRKVLSYNEDKAFTICGINPLTSINTPHYLTLVVKDIAKITRHWMIGNRITNKNFA